MPEPTGHIVLTVSYMSSADDTTHVCATHHRFDAVVCMQVYLNTISTRTEGHVYLALTRIYARTGQREPSS